jgi:hypothetical protein
VVSPEGACDGVNLFEIMEGSAVIAVNASQDSEVANRQRMNDQISGPGCSGRLNTVPASLLKIASRNIAGTKRQYRAFSEAWGRFVGYFREGNTRAIYFPSLSVAVRLIVFAYASKLRWQREIEYGSTGPFYYVGLTRQARLSSNSYELVAQRPEALL